MKKAFCLDMLSMKFALNSTFWLEVKYICEIYDQSVPNWLYSSAPWVQINVQHGFKSYSSLNFLGSLYTSAEAVYTTEGSSKLKHVFLVVDLSYMLALFKNHLTLFSS